MSSIIKENCIKYINFVKSCGTHVPDFRITDSHLLFTAVRGGRIRYLKLDLEQMKEFKVPDLSM